MSSPATSLPALSPFQQRLLAEALRRHEKSTEQILSDPVSELAAISMGGDFEARVRTRAEGIADRTGVRQLFAQFDRSIRITVVVLWVIGALLGAAAAKATLTPDSFGLVNFYWVLLTLLGVHTLALLLWFIALVLRPHLAPPTPLRPAVHALMRLITPSGKAGSLAPTALTAWSSVISGSAIGRWGISTLIHGFWLALLAGTLGTVLLLLSARQFDFVWETTILPERTFIAVTERLGRLPHQFGLQTPDHSLIVASRREATQRPPPDARRAWSSLLIGSLIAYGMLPRAVMLLLTSLLYRYSRDRFRLDLDLPGYARLRSVLMPSSRRIGVIDADAVASNESSALGASRRLPVAGDVALLGVEIETPHTGWPPPLMRKPRDLGIVTDREAHVVALKTIAELQRAPVSLLLVCSLAASPDRGLARLLREIRTVHHGPLGLLLTQSGKTLNRLGESAFTERLADWRELAAGAGIDARHVSVLDLDDTEALRAFHFARERSESGDHLS